MSHPGGSLGKQLLLRVGDIMHIDEAMPRVHKSAHISAALLEMTEKKLGMTAIVEDGNRLIGIFTDGDLRRMLGRNLDIHNTLIVEVMTPNCTVIKADALAAEAMQIMEQKKINGLIVVDDEQHAVGALNMHDLIRAGIV